MSNSESRTSAMWIMSLLVLGALSFASPLAAEDSPWNVAVKLGQASIDSEFVPGFFGWRVDDDDTAARVTVGYTLHRYLGIEAGYHDLGSYSGLPGKCLEDGCSSPLASPLKAPLFAPVAPLAVDFTGFSLSAVPRWPVTEKFLLFGKLGIFDWKGDLTPAFNGQNLDRPSDTDLLAGIGARYDFSNGLGILVEYDSSDLYDSLSLGANWRF